MAWSTRYQAPNGNAMKIIIRAFLRYKKSANRRIGTDNNDTRRPIATYFAQLSRQLSMRGWNTELWGKTTVFRLPSKQVQRRVIFYIHGGSFTSPTSPAHFRFCRELAQAMGAEIYMIEYNVAPTVKYPAIHKQCQETIISIFKTKENISEIILAGDSAGAGIVPTIFSALPPDVASRVKASILMSPWIDYEGSSLSAVTRQGSDPWLNSRGLKPVALQYFENSENLALAQASLRKSLDDQPPTLISVGDDEILFSDAVELFGTMLKNGIPSSVYVGRNLWHVWPLFPIPERRDFIDEVVAFVELLEMPKSNFLS